MPSRTTGVNVQGSAFHTLRRFSSVLVSRRFAQGLFVLCCMFPNAALRAQGGYVYAFQNGGVACYNADPYGATCAYNPGAFSEHGDAGRALNNLWSMQAAGTVAGNGFLYPGMYSEAYSIASVHITGPTTPQTISFYFDIRNQVDGVATAAGSADALTRVSYASSYARTGYFLTDLNGISVVSNADSGVVFQNFGGISVVSFAYVANAGLTVDARSDAAFGLRFDRNGNVIRENQTGQFTSFAGVTLLGVNAFDAQGHSVASRDSCSIADFSCDLSYALPQDATTTPEPATIALVIPVLLLGGELRRRQSQRNQS